MFKDVLAAVLPVDFPIDSTYLAGPGSFSLAVAVSAGWCLDNGNNSSTGNTTFFSVRPTVVTVVFASDRFWRGLEVLPASLSAVIGPFNLRAWFPVLARGLPILSEAVTRSCMARLEFLLGRL